MAVPEPDVARLLADALFAADPAAILERPSLRGGDGVLFRFSRLAGSAAWRGAGGPSVSEIGLSIRPVRIAMTETGQ
jgi:hypothetical protein